jgi:hydrogenase expression/formation protein HypC
MCLAFPGKIIACGADEAVVELRGNRLQVCTALTPNARVGDWVLVHAGFAISQLDEADALATWDDLRAAYGEPELEDDLAAEPPPRLPEPGGGP